MKTIPSQAIEPKFFYDFPQRKDTILFFDIETTGFSPKTSSLYLIGVMFYSPEKQEFQQIQWFAERHKEERNILVSFLDMLDSYEYLYHFNGKTFDIPYILEKCRQYALPLTEHAKKLFYDTDGIRSIDLLVRIRKQKHFFGLKRCNQKALEEFLGIYREDTFSGGDLISVYAKYTQMRLLEPEKAEKLERILLLHNAEDVEMMLSICSLLQYELFFSEASPFFSEETLKNLRIEIQKEQDSEPEEAFGSIRLFLPLPCTFPREWKKSVSYPDAEHLTAELEFKKDSLAARFPLIRSTLKFFFADYKNYDYLPAEDMAVHKSISSFMDRSLRERATKETCYIKKTGWFLPTLLPQKPKKAAEHPLLFSKAYKASLAFYELPDDANTAFAFWRSFLMEQFSCL